MSTWATVGVAVGSSVVTTLACLAVQDWRSRPRPIHQEDLDAMAAAFRNTLGLIRAAVPRPDVDDRCPRGPHVCHNGDRRPYCRESCTMCSGDAVRPCCLRH